ncbi:MAG: hypothetical protein FJ026_09895, partial [Chloroflexi bacterium]|nr:hypothetical protein [Chloroflexota bacterium]
MAVRNLAKALGVLLLFCMLTSLVALAVSSSSRYAWAEGLLPPPSVEPAQEPGGTLVDIPLHLRIKIDPRVLKQFDVTGGDSLQASGPHVRYIVHLSPKADLSAATALADTRDRRERIVATLRQTAQASQAGLVAYLQAQQIVGQVTTFSSYWIVNALVVTSDLDTLLAVAARPEVERVKMDQVRHLSPVAEAQALPSPQVDAALSSAIEWNIARIGADQVWNAYGLRGEGMVVASLDSGVDWTHPALQRKYRGHNPGAQTRHDYNWFDATRTYPSAPADGDGHGTHTMGTMVGSLASGQNQVGVAPEARWIAAKVFDDQGNAYDS